MSGPPPRRRRRRAEPVAAADVVRRFRRREGAPGAGPAGAAAEAWPRVVGAAVAAHSAPVRRSRAGVLTVACSSAAWAQELSLRREELTRRLAAECPGAEVAGLRFAVADHVPQPATPSPSPPPRPVVPGPAARAAGARAAEGVGDARLRELVERAATAAAARARPRRSA